MIPTPLTVEALQESHLETDNGTYSRRLYRGSDGSVGMALWMGDLRAPRPVLCRVHSSCFTSEGLCGLDCDCAAQLSKALAAVATHGRGLIFYLLQEGRGAGLSNKAKDRSIVQRSRGAVDTYSAYRSLGLDPDPRRYDLIRPICEDLAVQQPLQVMTNNPLKLGAMARAGIPVVPVGHELPASPFNAQYLAAKARNGHVLTPPRAKVAALPPWLEGGEPGVREIHGFRRVASYALPVAAGAETAWMHATCYWHQPTGHERLVLSHLEAHAATELQFVYRERLPERLCSGGKASRRYRSVLTRILQRGRGSILAVPGDGALLKGREGPTAVEDAELLEAHSRAQGAIRYEEVA